MTDPDSPQIAFLRFVRARHDVWERRQAGDEPPWTDHPYLQAMKFTNVYRVLDYGTQFILKELADPELPPAEALFRVFLYRNTGNWDAWKAARDEFGRYPLIEDLPRLRELWMDIRADRRSVFTGAYLIYPGSLEKGADKVTGVTRMAERAFGPDGVTSRFFSAETQKERFGALKTVHGIADFLSMQILTDWGYLPQCGEDRENEFVVMGPGARRGAKFLFQEPRIQRDSVHQARELVLGMGEACPIITLPGGRGRPPSLMDVQNCLCEFSKLWREMLRGGPKQSKVFRPAHPGPQPAPALPAHW